MSRRPIQDAVVRVLAGDPTHALTYRELAAGVFGPSEDFAPEASEAEMASVRRAVYALERRGVVWRRRVWIRDLGTYMVVALHGERVVIDDG
jgi:hypothetical protein